MRRERPDLLLTEEELPAFDALLARVRELPANRRVPGVGVNPDDDAETRYGDAVVLTDCAQLRTLLLRARATETTAPARPARRPSQRRPPDIF